jgi:hypothetical protein
VAAISTLEASPGGGSKNDAVEEFAAGGMAACCQGKLVAKVEGTCPLDAAKGSLDMENFGLGASRGKADFNSSLTDSTNLDTVLNTFITSVNYTGASPKMSIQFNLKRRKIDLQAGPHGKDC